MVRGMVDNWNLTPQTSTLQKIKLGKYVKREYLCKVVVCGRRESGARWKNMEENVKFSKRGSVHKGGKVHDISFPIIYRLAASEGVKCVKQKLPQNIIQFSKFKINFVL